MRVLDDQEVFFEIEAEETRYVGTAKSELQKEWRLLADELPGSHLTVLIDYLELVKLEREVMKNKKSLLDEVKVLRKTVGEENAAPEGVEKKLTQLKSSVSALDLAAARVAESDKLLETTRAEVGSLKEQMTSADTEKADFNKLLAQFRVKSEQCRIRLIVATVG